MMLRQAAIRVGFPHHDRAILTTPCQTIPRSGPTLRRSCLSWRHEPHQPASWWNSPHRTTVRLWKSWPPVTRDSTTDMRERFSFVQGLLPLDCRRQYARRWHYKDYDQYRRHPSSLQVPDLLRLSSSFCIVGSEVHVHISGYIQRLAPFTGPSSSAFSSWPSC